MFKPNLDEGLGWQNVASGSSPSGLFGYLYRTNLSFRSDAVLVNVTMSDTTKDWVIAGYLLQLWEKDGVTYQVKYHPIRLDNKTIVSVEPLETSVLLFNPVDWLSNWTIDIKARPYQLAEVGSVNLNAVTEQIALNQQVNTERYYRLIEAISNIEYLVEGVNDVVVEGFTERQPRELEDDERDLFGFS